MKKILLVVASVFLIASCAKSETSPVSSVTPVAPVDNLSIPPAGTITKNFDSEYSDIKSEYRETATMNNCMVNSINMCLSQTVSEKARIKSDESICEDLSDAMSIEFCKQGIILSKIEKDGDITLCDSLKQNKDGCIMQAAMNQSVKKKDIKICDAIQAPKTPAGGPAMTSPRDNCINQAAFSIAMSTQDEKFCDKILSEEQKKMCKTSIENQKEMAKKSVPVPIGQPAPVAKETPIQKK